MGGDQLIAGPTKPSGDASGLLHSRHDVLAGTQEKLALFKFFDYLLLSCCRALCDLTPYLSNTASA